MGKLYAALVILSLIWGTSFLFIKVLVNDFGPWGVVFWRSFFGALTLLLILFLRKEKQKWDDLPWLSIILVGILNNVLPWGLIALSETKISSSMASVVNATTPIWTILIGFLIFSNKLRKMQWLGIFIGFIGILILLNLNIKQLLSENLLGVGTMIGATICYGFGTQLSKRYLKDLSITFISASTLFVAAVTSFFMMLVVNPEAIAAIVSVKVILYLIGLGVFGSGFAYLFFYYMVKEGSPEFAALVTYLVPVSAMLWGKLLLGEVISINMLIGLVFIFSGVYLSSYKRKSKQVTSKIVA